MSSRKILLLEPNYKNKYPPMGLMKIASYYRCRHDEVRFYKGDLKNLAAILLFEDFFSDLNTEKYLGFSIHSFIAKRGARNIIEYIRTGKHASLEAIMNFSRSSIEADCSLTDFLKLLSNYRNRYKEENYPKFDRVCVTTLFTFYWKEIIETIQFAKKLCSGTVYVGGIAASLVPDYIEKETGIRPHIGLLNKPYAHDNDNKGNVIIDELPLDYSILDEIDYHYPTENAYFAYMTRGCVNRCDFCAVPKLEPIYCNYTEIKSKIEKIDECFGKKRDLLLMDNNVFASKNFTRIIDEINECGFEKKATYKPQNEYDLTYRNLCYGFKLGEDGKNLFNDRAYTKKLIKLYDNIANRLTVEEKGEFYNKRETLKLLFPETATKDSFCTLHEYAKSLYDKHFKQNKQIRSVDFNQGLDGRLVNEKNMSKISEIAIRPLRIAFDYWGMKNAYQRAIRTAAKFSVSDLSNYLLYNFRDHPDELYKRMRLNVDLCEELGVTIYSFPMKYHPIENPTYFRNRNYIGEPHWNRKFIRAIQAVLNSTHGKIGRGLSFFEAAFGKDIDEFHKILWMPETLIIQRYKYDKQKRDEYYGNNPTPYDTIDEATGHVTADWWEKFNSLSTVQRTQAQNIIADNHFSDLTIEDEKIKEVLMFYQIKQDKA